VFKHALAGNGFFRGKRVTETRISGGEYDPFFQRMEKEAWPVTLHSDMGCDNYDEIPLQLTPSNPIQGCEVPDQELKLAGARYQWWKDLLGVHYPAFFDDRTNTPKRNFRKIQHLKVWDALLARYPYVKIVWAHMGLSKELKRLHPIVHSHIMMKLFDTYPNLMTDVSWDVIAKMLLVNHNDGPINPLLHDSHEDFDKDASDFLFNQTHVTELRAKLHAVFDEVKDDVHATGSANVILGPTFAMAMYLDMFHKYNDRFITGEQRPIQ
jgi:hypothetical protein